MSNNKEVKCTLADAVKLLLIAIREGELVVFPNEDTTADYIGLLEECNKRPLLTYVVSNRGKEEILNCYSNEEVNSVMSLIVLHEYTIISIKVN